MTCLKQMNQEAQYVLEKGVEPLLAMNFPTNEAQCQGIQEAEWEVIPHQGDLRSSGRLALAYEAQGDVFAVQLQVQQGPFPPEKSFLELERRNLEPSSIKLAEEEDAVIVRLFQTGIEEGRLKLDAPKDIRTYATTLLETEKLYEVTETEKVAPYKIVNYRFEREGRL
ncbi:glycosyl hydrolase-related protein [Shouchella shacheensis]|uniref:glycosyl hydrolase-related protein n=1 Tax=Shouchella shacheensis TaxID=1649580 RepID=UPI0015D60328|nr:glycosyl hydrolase-related protein [Shouchella shacheensis]